jgi:hypothetical protein
VVFWGNGIMQSLQDCNWFHLEGKYCIYPENYKQQIVESCLSARPHNITCDSERCQYWWFGEWCDLVLPLEELLSELILHMLDLRDPRELGLLGGVWKDQLLSEPFKSIITCEAKQ